MLEAAARRAHDQADALRLLEFSESLRSGTNAQINAIMQEPPAQEKLKTIGFDVMIKNEVEAADYFKSEVATWGKMTRAIGITVKCDAQA